MTALDWNQVLKEAQTKLSNAAKPDLKPDNAPFCQADLLFEADTAERLDADQDAVNPSLASMEPAHWHVTDAPDGFYYLKEGMEPPKDTLGFYRGLWELLKWWVPLGAASVAVWWLWVTLWPETIKWLLWMAGK